MHRCKDILIKSRDVRFVPVVLTLTLVLSSCSSFGPWPGGAADRDYFEALYAEDEANQALQEEADYLYWIRRFYNGLNLVPGWNQASRQLLARVEEEQQAEVSDRLDILGRDIASEWAKDNRVRLINTRMVNIWRQALMEAIAQDDLLPFLDVLEADVNALLSGSLDGDDIYFERYYEDEFDDF